MASCGCGVTWGGMNTCHCAGCHNTFSGLTAFDHHRHYNKCVDPRDRNLVVGKRGYWGSPSSDSEWWGDKGSE